MRSLLSSMALIFHFLFIFLRNEGIQTSSSIKLFPRVCAVPPSLTRQVIIGRDPLEVAPRC